MVLKILNLREERNNQRRLWIQIGFLILPHPLTNFEIKKYHQKEPRFNWVYSRVSLSNKIKDGKYVIKLDEYSDIGTHWIASYAFNNNVTNFDSFGAEHIPKEIKNITCNKNIRTNIFRMQAYNSVLFWIY